MAKKPDPAPSSDKPKSSLPKTIVNTTPSALKILTAVADAAKLLRTLEQELEAAKADGAVALARAFVALHRLKARVDEELKPLDALYTRFKDLEVPALFETEGVPNVSLDEGYRVGVSSKFRASIKPDQKDEAYKWLKKNGLGDIITSTVNASTLSAAFKELMEEKNVEPPDAMFNIAMVPGASVTQTK